VSGRSSLLAPTLPPEEGKKEEKGRETYKLSTKTVLLILLIILLLLIILEIRQNLHKLKLSFPELATVGTGVPPECARQYREFPDWTQKWTGTGLRNARIGIWIRIAGRKTSSVLFRSQL